MSWLAEMLVIMARFKPAAKLLEYPAIRAHLDGLVQACVCEPEVPGGIVHRHHVGHEEGVASNSRLDSSCKPGVAHLCALISLTASRPDRQTPLMMIMQYIQAQTQL